MQNLLETYAESSNSSHISIESDKQPVSVDVDETSTVQEHQDTRKQPPKTFKPQEQIFKFFTPVQKQVPASSEQLPSLPNNPSEKPRSSCKWSDWRRTQRRGKDAERKKKFRAKQESSNTEARKRKAVMSMISQECYRTGTDILIDGNRQAIAARVFNALEQPKKQRKVDDEGHAVVTASYKSCSFNGGFRVRM